MKICNCPKGCFNYIEKFGFYRSSFYRGVPEICMISLPGGGVFFSYHSRTKYHIYLVPGRIPCAESVQKLIDLCYVADTDIEISNLTPSTYYSVEDFLSITRDKKLESLI